MTSPTRTSLNTAGGADALPSVAAGGQRLSMLKVAVGMFAFPPSITGTPVANSVRGTAVAFMGSKFNVQLPLPLATVEAVCNVLPDAVCTLTVIRDEGSVVVPHTRAIDGPR